MIRVYLVATIAAASGSFWIGLAGGVAASVVFGAVLEVSVIRRLYAQDPLSQVRFGMDLDIAEGEVATLLGRNGMGKATTVQSILGLTPARRSSIRFRGKRIEKRALDRIARTGLAVVPEGLHIFPNLSVRENLLAFAAHRNGSGNPCGFERVVAMFPRLAERASDMGNELSGGEQQMLAIGRALMTNPTCSSSTRRRKDWRRRSARKSGAVWTRRGVKARLSS